MSSSGLIPVSLKVNQNYINAFWSGLGTLSGTVKIGSSLIKRRVRLYETNTGVLLWEKWSNSDGSYTFEYLSKLMDFTITSTDYTGTYNDVIAARVRAV